MGQHDVSTELDERQLRAFTKALLDDVQALEQMMERGLFESGIRRIGAEQEMFLIDDQHRPAPLAVELLARLDDPAYTTELARFNLEVNLTPHVFGDSCLSDTERELGDKLTLARERAAELGVSILLAGILPTLRLKDLGLDNMSPVPRYFALNQAMKEMRGSDFQFSIKGVDELQVQHDNIMLESANTSFQIHFQVAPDEFAALYNLAQAVTAPVLAAATSSPLLLGRRLWHETRIALFQQSIDVRSPAHQARGLRPRVSFGDRWVQRSVLEIYREDIARFRILLATGIDEQPLRALAEGRVPPLTALRLHNGTVYRWNRPCYGVIDGTPHLRIESRVLPAGPSIADEVANAALFFGLMSSLGGHYDNVAEVMPFENATRNFLAAARLGLDSQIRWLDGRSYRATDLLLDELLPQAEAGLQSRGIAGADIDRYLGIIEQRVKSGRTGSQWTFDTLHEMGHTGTPDERIRALTGAMLANQRGGLPVHCWPLGTLGSSDWRSSFQTVEQIMTSDLFTVRPGDLVDLAASFMDWEHIRHVPVEDDQGRLVGLVSHRSLLRLIARGHRDEDGPVAVAAIMKPDPITVAPSTSTLDAIALMKKHRVSCLPVLDSDKLVGIITERDLVVVAGKLLEESLRTS